MAGKITKDSVTEVFNGQSDIAVFDAVASYGSTTAFKDIAKGGVSVGQVVADSTSWEGEEATLESILDEQGNTVASTAKKGTFAFACELANISTTKLTTFLKATSVTPATGATGISVTSLVKLGNEMPVITRPIAIFNEENNKFIMFPKAKIVSSFKLDGKLWRIRIKAVAEMVDTSELGTVILGSGAAQYETTSA